MKQKHYRELPPNEVVSRVREAADIALSMVKRELDLPNLRIQWFTPEDDDDRDTAVWHRKRHGRYPWKSFTYDDCAGIFWTDRPDVIHIRSHPSVRFVVGVVAHEARHAWQYKYFGAFMPTDVEERERDAHDWQDRFLSRIFDDMPTNRPPKPPRETTGPDWTWNPAGFWEKSSGLPVWAL